MRAYWEQLNERERMLVLIASISCIFYLCYVLIYAPLIAARQHAEAELIDKRATLQWMSEVKSKPLQVVPKKVSNGQLLTIIARELQSSSFRSFSYQLEQTGSGDIQLSYDKVPYNAFVLWLWTFSVHYQFSIKQFNCDASTTPGVVKAMMILSSK